MMKVTMALMLALLCSACETQAVEPSVGLAENEDSNNVKTTELGIVKNSFCDEINGQTWQSLEQLEAGRSMNGIAKMHWLIGFDAGQFRWRYSDVVEMGSYRCEGESVTLSSAMNDPRASGKLSSDKSELIINNVRYVLKPQ